MDSIMSLDSSAVRTALQEWFETRWSGEPMRVTSVEADGVGRFRVAFASDDAREAPAVSRSPSE